jgi:hypothetical protein
MNITVKKGTFSGYFGDITVKYPAFSRLNLIVVLSFTALY